MNNSSPDHSKTVVKGLLMAMIVFYIIFPLYLYGFTPVGPAVVQLFRHTVAGDRANVALQPGGGGLIAEAQTAPETAPSKDQPITVLLLGYGGPGHDGAYLTDSMMLVIADPKSKSLTLLSIPRDTLVKLPTDQQGGIWSKINTAYAYGVDDNIYPKRAVRYKGPNGGGNMAKDAVSDVVGIPVRYYIAMDFNAFRKLIDEVGGVDVDVEASFSSLYPKADNPEVDPDWTVVRFGAGNQHMNGERALEYARAREAIENLAEGSDFARSRRQKQIIEAFKDKVMSPSGLIHIPGLLSIAKSRVTTDIDIPSLGDLNELLTDWRGVKVTQASLTSENYFTPGYSSQGAYILVPAVGENDWSQIHTFVRLLIEDPVLAEEVARTKVIIRSGSAQMQTAKALQAKLQAQGFAVAPLETVASQPTTHIEDMSEGENPRLIDALKEAMGLPGLSVEEKGYPSPRVAIILGEDFTIGSQTPTTGTSR